MDIKNLVTERVGAFLGQRSAIPHALLTPADCEGIENFVSRRGRLRKIWGTTLYADHQVGNGEVKWLDYFRKRWIFQQGNGIGAETAEGSKAFLGIGEMAIGELNRVSSEKWQDTLYLSNGVENKFFQSNVLGDSFLQLGIIPPGNGRRIVAQQADITVTQVPYLGSELDDGECAYTFTWWDNVRRVESLPWGSWVGEDGLWLSAPDAYAVGHEAIFAGSPNNALRVDISAIKALGVDPRATHFLVYRRGRADGVWKLLTDPDTSPREFEFRISESYWDDTTAEADLGRILDQSLSPPPSGKGYVGYGTDSPLDISAIGPKFVRHHRDQLWLFGVDFPGTLNGTEPTGSGTSYRQATFYAQSGIAYGSDVANPEYWKYTYDIGRVTGQRDTYMGKFRNTLMFFKDSSSYYLDGTSPDNYEIRELDSKRGITISGSAQETTAGIIGLGAEGFTLFDSLGPAKLISEDITDMVEKIDLENADKIISSFDPVEEKYECHCPMKLGYNTTVFIYDIKSQCWDFTTRAGGAAHYGLKTRRSTEGLIGDKQNGRLFLSTDRSAVTMAGQTLHGVWRSKHFDFNSPDKLKGLQMVTIVARAKRDFRLSIDVIPDFSQRDCVSVKNIAPDVRTDLLAEDANDPEGMNWNEGQWGAGVVKKEFTILVQAIGKKLQLLVRNSDNDADRASFEIEEIILWAELMEGEDD